MLLYWVRYQGCLSSGNMEANRGCGGDVEDVGLDETVRKRVVTHALDLCLGKRERDG